VFAVVARSRWPTANPIVAHGTPPRCSNEIRRWRRSCGEYAGTPAAVQALLIALRSRSALEVLEHAPVGVAVVARAELEHRPVEQRRNADPVPVAGLGDGAGDAPASTWLVDVAPAQPLELAESVSAPTPQTLGGADYLWVSWSDGGARCHNIDADAAATYTAAYQAVQSADLVLTKTGARKGVATWTLSVRNQGPGAAESVVVTDTLPSRVSCVSAPGCMYKPSTRTVQLQRRLARAEGDRVVHDHDLGSQQGQRLGHQHRPSLERDTDLNTRAPA
jgi:hypothetical protein